MSNRIDLTQFEGHTEGPWEQYSAGYHAVVLPLDDYELGQEFRLGKLADAQLIADAPLLLAEVERLREGINTYLENAKSACNEILKLRELIE